MLKFMVSSDPLALIDVVFDAYKNACQQYSGKAIVVKLKKSGLYECHGEGGEVFEESKSVIMRSIKNGN